MKLKHIYLLAKSANHDFDAKNKFKIASMKYLRKLAESLNLDTGSFTVRFNAGGDAVSGDAVLHHDKFYIHVNESGCFWRVCNGQKDYTGGTNNWAIGLGGHGDDTELQSQILRAIYPVYWSPHEEKCLAF